MQLALRCKLVLAFGSWSFRAGLYSSSVYLLAAGLNETITLSVRTQFNPALYGEHARRYFLLFKQILFKCSTYFMECELPSRP